MTRINTNMASLMGTLYMNRNMESLNATLERMSTGLRINSAQDAPKDVIVSDVLRGELTGIESALRNAQRAENVMTTAEGAMGNIADLLLEIRQAVFEVANDAAMTEAEIEARQLELDKAVEAIGDVVSSSRFAGQQLLDGSLRYETGQVDPAAVTDLRIYKAPVAAAGGALPFQLELHRRAERAELVFANAAVASDVTVRLSGPRGEAEVELTAGMTSSAVMDVVNGTTAETGLDAELVDPGDPSQGVRILTCDYGSEVSFTAEVVEGNPGDFLLENASGNPATMDVGQDIQVDINGTRVTGEGLACHYARSSVDADIHFTSSWNDNGPGAETTFEITSGGALFQLGPRLSPDQQDSIGIPDMSTGNLGLSGVGFLDQLASGGGLDLSSGRLEEIMDVVDTASEQVSGMRSRIGSFQNNTLGMAIDNLSRMRESVSSARSRLVDADYAEESAAMVRQQVLVDATRAAIALAQQVPQHVLELLIQ